MKNKPFIILGRSNEAHIRFTDISISRNHSKIRYHNDNFYIEDLHSKFGTLTMIKNNFIILPNRRLTVQSGKLLCEFNLVKNIKSTLCCYSNKFLGSLDYYKLFDEQKQEMYLQELKTLQTLTGLDDAEEEENVNPIYNQTITKLLSNNNQFQALMKNTINMNNSDMINLLNLNSKKQICEPNTVLIRRNKRKLNIQNQEIFQSNLTNRNQKNFSQRNTISYNNKANKLNANSHLANENNLTNNEMHISRINNKIKVKSNTSNNKTNSVNNHNE